MTLYDALDRIDKIKPNAFTKTEKVAWISRLERMLCKEIYETHEGPVFTFNGYTDETDGQTKLSVPEPYDEIYIHYVSAMIDFHNREIVSYNNDMVMYNQAYTQFWAWYNRTHKPISGRFRFFTPNRSEIAEFGEIERSENVRNAYQAGYADGRNEAEGGDADASAGA